MQHEMIVILVGVRAVAQEAIVQSASLSTGLSPLQYDDAVLHVGRSALVSNFRREIGGSEVHQDEQLSRLERRPLL